MNKKHISATILLGTGLCLPMLGAAGRPSDGFLSFVLLFGFLFVLWGVMYLLDLAKKKIDELLSDLF
jgi:hypothetical protein